MMLKRNFGKSGDRSRARLAAALLLGSALARPAARADDLPPAPLPQAPDAAGEAARDPRATFDDHARAVSEALPAVSFAELLERARRDPPSVALALATLKRVEAEQRRAEGAYLPRLRGDALAALAQDSRLIVPSEPGVDSLALQLNASANAEWDALDRARARTVEAARRARRAEVEGVAAARRKATALALELYLRALFARELAADAALTLKRRSDQHAAIAELTRAGVRPLVDAQRAEVEIFAARALYESRTIEELAAEAALAVALGQPPTRALRPLPLPEQTLANAPLDPARASELAVAHRPELRQQREQIRARHAELAAARARRLPTAGVAAGAGVTHVELLSGVGLEGLFYGASGSLNLRWNGLDAQIWREADVAAGRIREAERELDALKLGVESETVESVYEAQRTQANLEQTEQLLRAAQVTRTAQHERYGAGIASLLELLDAEAVEQSARAARILAQRDFDIARSRVLASCGLLDTLTP